MTRLISNSDFAKFLKDYPLYSKIVFIENLIRNENFDLGVFFSEKAYKFYCPIESDYHTFKTHTANSGYWILNLENQQDGSSYRRAYFGKDDKLDFSYHLTGKCQSCNYKMNFLLNVFTEEPLVFGQNFPTIFLRKTGQLPAFERSPEKEVLDYLTEEDKENYKKALSNLAVSYGIGAFAYFRRVIENEIKRVVEDISLLEIPDSDKIKAAWNKYKNDHQMSNLIESIYPYLPKSLKELGNNPIKLLHQQLSQGIHELTEEECLEKAKKS